MSSNIQSLATVITTAIQTHQKETHVAMPGIVETFDAVAQTASVQPAINRVFKIKEGTEIKLVPSALPLLIHVPVIFPRGGGFSMTFPVANGDECLLVICDRAISNWHTEGGIKDPSSKRFNALSDAVAIPGLSSIPSKVQNYDTDNLELRADDGSVSYKLNADGSSNIHTDSDITVDTGGDLQATVTGSASITAPTINLTGAVNVTGTLDVSGASTLASTLDVQAPATMVATTMTAATMASAAIGGAPAIGGGSGGGLAIPSDIEITGALTNNGVVVGSTHSHLFTNADGAPGTTQVPS